MNLSSDILPSSKGQPRHLRKMLIRENSYIGLNNQGYSLQKTHKVIVHKRMDICISFILTIWACYVRLWKISQPTSVVFDEVHFGGFASKYINKKFFMDVHPPLAKIMITWAAQFFGFNGSFDFKKIGMDYLEANVPYMRIRMFCALNGIMLVPISYWTIRGCGLTTATAILTAMMICYENGMITNNRLILLDSILLFFTTFTILMWINFRNQLKSSFKPWWWIWLILTGTGLGLAVSCKWVGLFTIATIGIDVLKELWRLWGDLTVSRRAFTQHCAARAICLLIIPCIIYVACFQLHFSMLPKSGTGTNFMSPEFQTSLEGVKVSKSTPVDIIYGSKISIRHMKTRGGYLHSHNSTYPGGSKQQQVTLYPHADKNNWWVINKLKTNNYTAFEYVKNGDIVRLTHLYTNKYLHTHDVRPVTNDVKYQYEVSGYGVKGFQGDVNDSWRVEILEYKGSDPVAGSRLRARCSQFRLVSVGQNCALFSREYKLPKWGFNQQEVTCMKNAKLPKTVWRIEDTESELLPEGTELVDYEPKGFFGKFMELNKVMWNINQGLLSSHTFGSRPKDWPFLRRGISFWSKDNLKIYLLGNPFIFWISATCVLIYIGVKTIILVLSQRHMFSNNEWKKYDNTAEFFFISWGLHYFPFYFMNRQLFLHHYMSSLYMAILLVGVLFECATCNIHKSVRRFLVILSIITVIYVYNIFIPITYGEHWTTEKCLSATWRPDWDFKCEIFDKVAK